MLATEELTDAQWPIADAIARQLVIDGTDVNELRKAMAYLRDRRDQAAAGKKFFDYLKTLVRHGNAIGHSKRTLGYYQSLDAVCSQYLTSYQDDPLKMLYLLSWAARLVQYYDKGVPTGEIEKPTVMSEREAEIQAVTQANEFAIGQALEATVTSVKGSRVTYELLGTIRLTIKEPKRSKNLSEEDVVTVEITQLREDGFPKKVKVTE